MRVFARRTAASGALAVLILIVAMGGALGSAGPPEQGVSPIMAPYAADDQVPSLGGAEQPHFFALGQATTEQPTIQHIVYCSVLGFTPTWNYYDQQVIGTGTTTCQQAVEVIRMGLSRSS
jgi:hypothetical protein